MELKLPGYEKADKVQAVDVLEKPELVKAAKKVVVIGEALWDVRPHSS